jgi:tRNA pseudouridine-54 N-methylase
MVKYTIAYLDESNAEIRKFKRFSNNHFNVVSFIPKASIEDTCEEILESHLDALVSDFEFTEELSTVHYDGADLVSLFLKKRENFPVFILTSHEGDAIPRAEDVNIIYEKKEMGNGEKFLYRIKSQIEKYKHKLEEEENRLLDLIAASKERRLNDAEIDELSELDSKIEKALDKESRIPSIFRNSKEASELSELLKKVDELAKKLDSKK